jgi:hypothetical protein
MKTDVRPNTQLQRVLKITANRWLDKNSCQKMTGSSCLAQRIANLSDLGFSFKKQLADHVSRDNNKGQHMKYRLKDTPENEVLWDKFWSDVKEKRSKKK